MRKDYVGLLKSCLQQDFIPFDPVLLAEDLLLHDHIVPTELEQIRSKETDEKKALELCLMILPRKDESAFYGFIKGCKKYKYDVHTVLEAGLQQLPKDISTPDGRIHYGSKVQELLRISHRHNCEIIRNNWNLILNRVKMEDVFVDPLIVELEGRMKRVLQRGYMEMLFPEKGTIPGERIGLMGDPGMGKSVILNKIALDWSAGSVQLCAAFDFVLLIPLRKVQPGSSLESVIRDYFEFPAESAYFYDKVLRNADDQKRVLFLLDGYDEFEPVKCQDLEDLIHFKKWKQATVIVTFRQYFSDQLPVNLTRKYQILGWPEEEQQGEFIQRQQIFSFSNSAPIMKQIAQLFYWGTKSTLFSTPILLTVICCIGAEIKEKQAKGSKISLFLMLQSFQGNLLEQFIKQLEKQKRNIPISFERIIEVVGKKALEGHPDLKHLKTSDVAVEKELEDDITILNALVAERAGLIFERKVFSAYTGMYETTYEFSHKYLQDFFAAQYLAKLMEDDAALLAPLSDIHGSLSYFLTGFSNKYLHLLFVNIKDKESFRVPWVPRIEGLQQVPKINHLALIGSCREEDEHVFVALAARNQLQSLDVSKFSLSSYRVPCGDSSKLTSISFSQCSIRINLLLDICKNIHPAQLTLDKTFIIAPNRPESNKKDNMQYYISASKTFSKVTMDISVDNQPTRHTFIDDGTEIRIGIQPSMEQKSEPTVATVETGPELTLWHSSFTIYGPETLAHMMTQLVSNLLLQIEAEGKTGAVEALENINEIIRDMKGFESTEIHRLTEGPFWDFLQKWREIGPAETLTELKEALMTNNFDFGALKASWIPGAAAMTACRMNYNLPVCLLPDFESSRNLTELCLAGNLSDIAVRHLTEAMDSSKLNLVTSLDVSCNATVGIIPELASSFKQLPKLTILNLAHCHLNEAVVEALAQVLSGSLESLRELNIAGNIVAIIHEKVTAAISAKPLRFLDISFIDVNVSEFIDIIHSLSKGTIQNTLTSLVVGPNSSETLETPSFPFGLSAALNALSGLQELVLKNCKLSTSLAKQQIVVKEITEINHFREVVYLKSLLNEDEIRSTLIESIRNNPESYIPMVQAIYTHVSQMDETMLIRFLQSRQENARDLNGKDLAGILGDVENILKLLQDHIRRSLAVCGNGWSTLVSLTDCHEANSIQLCKTGGVELATKYLTVYKEYEDEDGVEEILRLIALTISNVTEVPAVRKQVKATAGLLGILIENLLNWKTKAMDLAYLSAYILAQLTLAEQDEPFHSLLYSAMANALPFWNLRLKFQIIEKTLQPFFALMGATPAAQYIGAWRIANLIMAYPNACCEMLEKEGGIDILQATIATGNLPAAINEFVVLIIERFQKWVIRRRKQELMLELD